MVLIFYHYMYSLSYDIIARLRGKVVMNNIDGRRLSDAIREEIRFKAIQEWSEGDSPTNRTRKYGTSRKIVYQWLNRYKQGGGWDGLKTLMGKTGPNPRLSPEQEQQLKMLLAIQTPIDYGYQTTLWTCQIIAALIEKKFQVKYVPAGVANLLKRLGLSPQKPRRGAWEQDKKKSRYASALTRFS